MSKTASQTRLGTNRLPATPPSGDGKTTATANAPQPRPPTLTEAFTKRLREIMVGGQPSKPEDTFTPLMERDITKHLLIGHLDDTVARELFSFAHQLEEKRNQIPRPRKPGDIKNCDRQLTLLTEQHKIVMDIFWQFVKATSPECDNMSEVHEVTSNWQIVQIRNKHDGLLGRLMQESGLPEGLLERFQRQAGA